MKTMTFTKRELDMLRRATFSFMASDDSEKFQNDEMNEMFKRLTKAFNETEENSSEAA